MQKKLSLLESPRDLFHRFDTDEINTMTLFFSLTFGLVASVIKVAIGCALPSLLWIFTGVYSACFALMKVAIYKIFMHQLNEKNRLNRLMLIAVMLVISAGIFQMATAERIDETNEIVEYPLWIIVLFSIYVVIFYVLAFRGVLTSRRKRNLAIFALRTVNHSAILLNLTLLQRMIFGGFRMSVKKHDADQQSTRICLL